MNCVKCGIWFTIEQSVSEPKPVSEEQPTELLVRCPHCARPQIFKHKSTGKRL